jgi:ferritin-like protein
VQALYETPKREQAKIIFPIKKPEVVIGKHLSLVLNKLQYFTKDLKFPLANLKELCKTVFIFSNTKKACVDLRKLNNAETCALNHSFANFLYKTFTLSIKFAANTD